MLSSSAFFLLSTLRLGTASEDIGYSLLFESSADEFNNLCVKIPDAKKPFPTWATGDFIIPSLGKLENGDRKFVGLLDAFGKLQRFSISTTSVCATYRMMGTGFYNESMAEHSIGHGLLFYETSPPRESCPLTDPMCNMPPHAPNDNNFVNTMKVGSKMLSITDAALMLEVNPKTLAVEGQHKFDDHLQGMITFTGSAHPLRHPKTGNWIDFVGNANPVLGSAKVELFQLSDADPSNRKEISAVQYANGPYMHSFGVTSQHIVLPRMPMKFDFMDVLSHPLSTAFKALDAQKESNVNGFVVVPIDGGKEAFRELPSDDLLYFVHTVNSYENDTDIVIDLTTDSRNPFISEALVIAANLNKTARDSNSFGVVKRFVIPLDVQKPISSSVISDQAGHTDFAKANPLMQSKKHCFYWGVKWFHDSTSYASMAVIKRDVCSDAPELVWHVENWYPSEPTMIPSTEPGAQEDEGLLIFTALDGPGNQTFLVTVDAHSMEEVSKVGPFPRIGFTTHGQFYPTGTWQDEAAHGQSVFV
eukprot:TRINITY_DN17442_c0_g1_i1.p1 TRINITY_DN17442_c0_g1~~TRINITY_DN17442_c0_g1_i1.p1  ORF type:complete len:531 (+),score=116.10 TRINITY_DN17442_c0_g1_i1:75-1667(+)